MEFITVSCERLCPASVRGFQVWRDNHKGCFWSKSPVIDFLRGLNGAGCHEALYQHAEILAIENSILRQKRCCLQDGFEPHTIVPVSHDFMEDEWVKRQQIKIANHQGGPWRKVPAADFIVSLWVRHSYGALCDHAEILAAENAVLLRKLACANDA